MAASKAIKKSEAFRTAAMQHASILTIVFLAMSTLPGAAEPGDAAAGERAFRACAACHSLESDRNMTGPSLAGVADRKAGSLASFPRYSDAMKQSGIEWNEQSLDRYLENPAQFIPDNHMTFPGIADAKTRADIVAFLMAAGPEQKAGQNQMGGMGGMGTQRTAPKLKSVDASSRIKSITYCRDTFHVTTEDGKSRDFWERNLRFKTDSSEDGPAKGSPAIVAAGMMGDRASVIFSAPEEISSFVVARC
jgi:cytochrome c